MFTGRKQFGSDSVVVKLENRLLRLLRLDTEECNSEASSCSRANQDQSRKIINLQAYLLAKQRMHEIETQKAMTIVASRHERGKAGGPL